MLRPLDRSQDGKQTLYMTTGHAKGGTRLDKQADGVGPGVPCHIAIAFFLCLLPWEAAFCISTVITVSGGSQLSSRPFYLWDNET